MLVGAVHDFVGILIALGVRNIVPGVLFRLGKSPAVAVVGLDEEVLGDGLGVGDAAPEGITVAALRNLLIHRSVRPCHVFIRDIRGVQTVVAQRIAAHHGESAPSLSEPLAQQREAAGGNIGVVAHVTGVAVVHPYRIAAVEGIGVSVIRTALHVIAVTELDAGLEEDGGVLAEHVVEPDAETVAVGIREARILLVVEQIIVVQISGLGCGRQHVLSGMVEKVVAAKVHLAVTESPGSVGAGHVGRGDAGIVPESPASAAAAAHIAHHIAGQVVEAAVIGVVGVQDHAELTLVGEVAEEARSLVAPVVHQSFGGRDVVTDASHHVTERTVHHAALHRKVDHGLLFAVVDAGEFCLLALFVHHLHLVDDIGGDVLAGELRVVKEEGFAAYGDFVDSFAVRGDAAVVAYLDAGKLLQKVFQHVVVGGFERRGVVFYRILLDDDRVAHVGNRRPLKQNGIGCNLEHSKVQILLYRNCLAESLVAEEFRPKHVFGAAHAFENKLAVVARKHVLVGVLRPFAGERNGGERHGLAVLGILKCCGDFVLGAECR